jgi:hypothetical protein
VAWTTFDWLFEDSVLPASPGWVTQPVKLKAIIKATYEDTGRHASGLLRLIATNALIVFGSIECAIRKFLFLPDFTCPSSEGAGSV